MLKSVTQYEKPRKGIIHNLESRFPGEVLTSCVTLGKSLDYCDPKMGLSLAKVTVMIK